MKIVMKVLLAMLLVSCSCSIALSEENENKCDPVFDGAIALLAFECLNDSTALVIDSTVTDSGWQYSFDSNNDGVTFGRVGGEEFELFGIAVKETSDELIFVLNGNLPLAGFASSGAKDGNIGWGDLFLDVDSGTNFTQTSDASKLYGIRFSASNDSATDSIGVYGSVEAKNVSLVNQGFRDFGHYKSYVTGKGGHVTLGDLVSEQTYYTDTANKNVIGDYQRLGDIQFVTPSELAALDYAHAQLGGIVSIAFKFKKKLIIDECGVLGGDGSSCIDCAGTYCGQTTLDQCGVCGGDGTSCLDCAGTPFGTEQVDQCGVCGGDGTSCLDCAGTPFGTKQVDQCGVCNGDGTSCLDCKGTLFGDLSYDRCGVCGGDGTSCLDCKGVVYGITEVDQCGVCGGDGTSCLDCAGTPFGSLSLDSCGVCGGDNKACTDCKGDIHGTAIIDSCGVCAGDGTSCLDCVDNDISEVQTILDGHAVAQRHWNLYALKQLSARSRSKRTKRFIKNSKRAIEELYLQSWQLVWSIPSIQKQCANEVRCSNIDNAKVKTSYADNARRLHSILKKTSRRVASVNKRGRAKARRLKRRGSVLWILAQKDLEAIPEVRSVCSQRGPGIL